LHLNNFTFYNFLQIKYETCAFVEQAERENNVNGRLKTSKISLGYYSQENAVRISTVTKIGLTDKNNPCLEGTANCGDNTVCVPTQDDGYEVRNP
jgi:nidogen (entactin)